MADESPRSEVSSTMDLKETELTLGLPGDSTRDRAFGVKRAISDRLDFKLQSGAGSADHGDPLTGEGETDEEGEEEASSTVNPPAAKAQLVGWPPVRASRKIAVRAAGGGCKFVKVAADGAPYLRKVDLELYSGYTELLKALDDLFSCFTIRNFFNEGKPMDPSGSEYVPTYEDKDGDWMMVGDVPWKMFVDSCKRLRLMKSSEATGLAPRTPPK